MGAVPLALSVALAHSLWQATVVAATVALLHFVLGRGAARLRYATAWFGLALQLAAFGATFVDALSPSVRTAQLLESAQGPVSMIHVWVASLWAAGALFMAIRFAAGLVVVRRMVKRAVDVEEQWLRRFEALRRKLGVRRVRWLATDVIDSPATVGWWRPVVLLPASALAGVPPSVLELLVAHELWHVRRWDYLLNLLQSAAEVALFFHPAMWWLSSRVRSEREACCDDGVVSGGADRVAYARALTAMEEHRARTGGLALASTGGRLMWRIDRLLRPQQRGRGVAGAWFAMLAVVVLSAGAVVAGPAPGAVNSAWLPPDVARHRAAIEEAARRHNVDADLLAMMVLAESGGDERARSRSGARGLMQLMPQTAEQVALSSGLPFNQARLDDPSFNVDLGARYLTEQLSRFAQRDDPVALAVAAYNAGPEAVQAALDGRATLSDETKKYQALVTGMWRDRGGASSNAFDEWRARIREKFAADATRPLAQARITLEFGQRSDPFEGKPFQHQGLDIAAAPGTPVLAPQDAVVKEVSSDPQKGTVVVLRHRGGIETRYHHLGSVSVGPDQGLARGQAFATVGATGKVTGPHVHFEVRDLGQPLDPGVLLDWTDQRRCDGSSVGPGK